MDPMDKVRLYAEQRLPDAVTQEQRGDEELVVDALGLQFADLFDAEEGRMGVAVTFIAILELIRETVIEVVQAEEYSAIHVRAASSVRLVADEEGAAGLPAE